MTTRQMTEVLEPLKYEPPLCSERESHFNCTTFSVSAHRTIDFTLSNPEKTVTSVSSDAPKNEFAVLKRKLMVQLGEPTIAHSEFTDSTSLIWHSADGTYRLELGLGLPPSPKTILTLKPESK